MATHYSIPAWRIPWTEEPGRLWSMGSQRASVNSAVIHLSSKQRAALVLCFPDPHVNVQFTPSLLMKNLPGKAGDPVGGGSVPVLGRSPRGGNSNPLHSPCLGNPMDRGAGWATGGLSNQSDMTEGLNSNNTNHFIPYTIFKSGHIYCFISPSTVMFCLFIFFANET